MVQFVSTTGGGRNIVLSDYSTMVEDYRYTYLVDIVLGISSL